MPPPRAQRGDCSRTLEGCPPAREARGRNQQRPASTAIAQPSARRRDITALPAAAAERASRRRPAKPASSQQRSAPDARAATYQRGSREPRPPPPTTPPAATAAVVSAAAPASEAATGAGRELRLRLRLVDDERTPLHLVLVELGDGLLGLGVGGHLDEPESARPAGGHVAHDAHVLDSPHLREERRQILIRRAVRQIPNIEPATHNPIVFWRGSAKLDLSRTPARSGGWLSS